jgi:hypothetical protein
MEDLRELLAEMLERCLAAEMQLPFVICAVSPNGNVMAFRFHEPGREPEVLAQHDEGQGFSLPMTVMVLDKDNTAVRTTIAADGRSTWH